MLRDVKTIISDGLLGFATATGDGLSVKIGASPVVSDTPIIITGDMDAAKKEYSSIAGEIASWYNHSGNHFGGSSENWT